MTQNATNVLKGSRVRMIEGTGADEQCASAGRAGGSGCPAPRARIIRQSPQEALVEIACECGRVIQLKCLYGGLADGQMTT